MSSTAPQLFTYNLTLQKPTVINCSVSGSFSAPKVQEVVAARGHVLELLRPDENGHVNTVCSTDVFGIIRIDVSEGATMAPSSATPLGTVVPLRRDDAPVPALPAAPSRCAVSMGLRAWCRSGAIGQIPPPACTRLIALPPIRSLAACLWPDASMPPSTFTCPSPPTAQPPGPHSQPHHTGDNRDYVVLGSDSGRLVILRCAAASPNPGTIHVPIGRQARIQYEHTGTLAWSQ
eukprot:gene12446-2268_t